MTPTFNCNPIFRGIFESLLLLILMFNWVAVIYSFLERKKVAISVSVFIFFIQFCVLQVFFAITQQKLFLRGSSVFLPLSQLPIGIFIILALSDFICSILYIFVFSNIERRRVTSEGVSKESLLLHEKALKLQNDSIRLEKMNNQMKIYGEEMQKQIKEKEILQAKINIHNGMNRLLLTSLKAVESNNKEEIEKAVSLWRTDALLLCKEADRKPIKDMLEDIDILAKSLSLKFEYNGAYDITDEKTLEMFYKTACECMINSVKHAGADNFFVEVKKDYIIFSNNGTIPEKEIKFGGGLKTINKLAEENGYTLIINCSEKFNLILRKKEQ